MRNTITTLEIILLFRTHFVCDSISVTIKAKTLFESQTLLTRFFICFNQTIKSIFKSKIRSLFESPIERLRRCGRQRLLILGEWQTSAQSKWNYDDCRWVRQLAVTGNDWQSLAITGISDASHRCVGHQLSQYSDSSLQWIKYETK